MNILAMSGRRAAAALLACALPACALWPAAVTAQVSIAPPVVVLGDAERVGSYMVRNNADVAQEVTVGFRFGYPASDSAGNFYMEYDDSASAARHSLVPWIRAFPGRFILPPGGEQVVRLMAQPAPDLAEGVYWTRLITASQPQSPPVDTLSEGVTAQIVFRIEQVTSVLYRRGGASTGIEIGALALRGAGAESHLLVPLRRTGNAPFLGSVAVRVRDGGGRVVHEAELPVAVYFDVLQRIGLGAAALSAGAAYTVDVTVTSERADLPRARLLPIQPVAARLAFTAH
jgi:hypothetical protein